MPMVTLKVAFVSGLIAIFGTFVGDTAAEIVAVTAALTALGWVWTRMVLPASRAFQRTHAAVGALEDLGSFMQETRLAVRSAERAAANAERKAERLDLRLDLIERHIGLFAAEDAVLARTAMRQVVEKREEQ